MADDFAAKVAARIRELREARGMSLRQLSRRSGVAPESVSRSERGISEVSLTNLSRIVHGLGVDLPAFFDFDRLPDLETVSLRDDIARAVQLLNQARPAERKRILGALELLSGSEKPLPVAAEPSPRRTGRTVSRRH
ncbi:MAG: helix-turn-helix protein [Pseudomonadota bacterium]|jgi:transcriptional regulator with XRE-family HTH domain